MRWVFPGDCSFPVSQVGRAVGGTWDMYPTRVHCNVLGASLDRGGKEPAATAKTFFLQDSAQERGCRGCVPKFTCTRVPVE